MRLDNKVALITGSGQNIGKGIAQLFASQGAKVIINGASDQAKIDAVAEQINRDGGQAMAVLADVSEPDQVNAMVDVIEAKYGAVNILVNNVGVRKKLPFLDITPAIWQQIINTNLSSCFYTSHRVLPQMRDATWGRIINVSGYDGFAGHMPQRAANVTAKAGMHGLSKAIAREFGEYEITANTVVVGGIKTQRDWSQYDHIDTEQVLKNLAIKHAGSTDDIAQACLYLAAQSGNFITGQAIHVNGGEYMF